MIPGLLFGRQGCLSLPLPSRQPGWDTVPRLRDLLDEWLETEPESPYHVSDQELDDDYAAERDPTPEPAAERARRP